MTLVQVTPAPGSPSPEDLPAVDIEVAFTSRPADAPSWRSIATGIITDLHTDRGRDNEFDDIRTGTCSVTISNRDSRYTPWNTNSPLYGLIRPGLRVRIMPRWEGFPVPLFEGYLDGWPQLYGEGLDATVHLTAGDTFKRLSDIDLPQSMYEFVVTPDAPSHWWRLDEQTGFRSYDAGTEPQVTSTDVGAVQRGEDDGLAWDGGRKACTFTINDFIRFPAFPIPAQFTLELWISCTDTTNLTVPWSIAGAPTFTGLTFNFGGASNVSFWELGSPNVTGNQPGLFDGELHHVVVVVDSTGTYLYVDGALVASGVNDDWYDAGGGTFQMALGNDPGAGLSATRFVGTLSNLALYNGRSLTAAQASDHYHAGVDALVGENTGERVARVLDYCQVPSGDRDLDVGDSTLGAHNPSGTGASYLQALAKTEQGRCYVAAANQVTFRSRHAVLAATAAGIAALIPPFTLDDRGVLGPAYEDVTIPFDEKHIRNPVTVTRDGGTAQMAVDRLAVERNGVHKYDLTGVLYETDNDSFDAASWTVGRYKDPDERIDTIVLRPQFFPDNWFDFLGLELGTPIRVLRRAPGGASTLTKDLVVEGVKHDYDRESGWTTEVALSPYDLNTYWVLDDSMFSVLDSTTRVAF